MNDRKLSFGTTCGFCLIIGLMLNLTACAGMPGLSGTTWQEEVLLHDGSKLVVERSVERGGPHEIGQRPSYTSETLVFRHPTTGVKVIWEDKATPDLGNSNFLPMALDIYQDTVYLVASPMGCLAYNKWGRPNPPYVVFRYGNETWKRVPLQELPAETKALNLIFSSPDTEVERLGKRFVDAESIKHINYRLRQPEYKTILREAMTNARSGCIKTDFYGKAGWLSPDWFTGQPSLEACLQFCARKRISAEICPCKEIFLRK